MTTTTININKQEINICDFLTTLQPSQNEHKASINITDYTDLGNVLFSLISVCQGALISFSDNDGLTDFQKENVLGCSSLSIKKVLEVAKNLIPHAEFELLDKLQSATVKNP